MKMLRIGANGRFEGPQRSFIFGLERPVWAYIGQQLKRWNVELNRRQPRPYGP